MMRFEQCEDKDYYAVLNIDPQASSKDIREAYYQMRNTYKGDNQALYSMLGEVDVESASTEIEEAFQVLSNPISRQRYDAAKNASTQEAQGFPISSYGLTEVEPNKEFDKKPSEQVVKEMESMISEMNQADGELYRKLRELRGVSREEIQETTKVSIAYIKNIEENNFEMLPQLVYVKGFLKSYMRHLGVPQKEKLIEAYVERFRVWIDQKN